MRSHFHPLTECVTNMTQKPAHRFFLAVSLLAGPFLAFMKRFGAPLGKVEKIMGILLILTGILIVTNGMGMIAELLIDIMRNGGRIG